MVTFNVINYDFNGKKFKSYDIMPYLMHCYEKEKNKPKTFEEFKEFVDSELAYQYWSRTEYEIILADWPGQKHKEKWDVYEQAKMNLDLIVNLLMQEINEKVSTTSNGSN